MLPSRCIQPPCRNIWVISVSYPSPAEMPRRHQPPGHEEPAQLPIAHAGEIAQEDQHVDRDQRQRDIGRTARRVVVADRKHGAEPFPIRTGRSSPKSRSDPAPIRRRGGRCPPPAAPPEYFCQDEARNTACRFILEQILAAQRSRRPAPCRQCVAPGPGDRGGWRGTRQSRDNRLAPARARICLAPRPSAPGSILGHVGEQLRIAARGGGVDADVPLQAGMRRGRAGRRSAAGSGRCARPAPAHRRAPASGSPHHSAPEMPGQRGQRLGGARSGASTASATVAADLLGLFQRRPGAGAKAQHRARAAPESGGSIRRSGRACPRARPAAPAGTCARRRHHLCLGHRRRRACPAAGAAARVKRAR